MPKENTLNEMEIKKLIQQEIKQCFEELSSDVKDIKKALLGDGIYSKTGLMARVESNEKYVEESRLLKIQERAVPALTWYESWEKEGVFARVVEVLDAYGKWKWFIGLIAGGSLAGIVSAVLTLIEIIKRIPL